MKREIKFRGWNDKHNKWLYGYYANSQGFSIIIEENYEERTLEDVLVNKKTVDQYTGLKDKNGKEIYEGDIVIIGEKLKAKVVFYDGAFRMQDEFAPTTIDTVDMGCMMREYGVRIIGNVFSNPELLKGGTK